MKVRPETFIHGQEVRVNCGKTFTTLPLASLRLISFTFQARHERMYDPRISRRKLSPFAELICPEFRRNLLIFVVFG